MATTINKAWIDSATPTYGTKVELYSGVYAWILTRANETYTLDVDVITDASAFIFGNANIIFDLNSHTITYGNASPPTVVNGGFETDEIGATTVTGWDLTNAPHAAIAANTNYLYGDKVLRFSNITSAEYIVSDTIAIPVSGRSYTATISPRGPTDAYAYLYVLDAVTGDVVGTSGGTGGNLSGGGSLSITFTSDSTLVSHGVKLKFSATPASGQTQSVVVDYATLTASRDYGVICTKASWYLPTWMKISSITTPMGSASNATIQNGAIVQGQGIGYASTPIFAKEANNGITLDNVDASTNGIDPCIDFSYATNVTVQNSTISSTSDNITNRMDAAKGVLLSLSHVYGTSLIESNTISGAPQASIFVGDATGVTIRDNLIYPNAMATECYGIWMTSVHDFEVSGNTITADGTAGNRSGRGIFIDGVESANPVSSNGEIFNNYVDIREKANREYGSTGIEATALRLRTYFDIGWTGIHIHDNTFIARTAGGTAEAHGAIGFRITTLSNTGNVDLDNIIEDNTFKAIVETEATATFAHAVELANLGANTSPLISNNTFESNDVSLALGGIDGANPRSGYFLTNTFRKNTADAAEVTRTYISILAGYSSGTVSGITIVDAIYANGATSSISVIGTGSKTIDIGWLSTIEVLDGSDVPIEGATVTVNDESDATVATGTTDASGLVSGVVTLEKRLSGTTSLSETDNYNPHTIQVNSDTPVSQAIIASGTITLGGAVVSATSYTYTGPTVSNWNEAATYTVTPVGGVYTGVITPHTDGTATISPTMINYEAESAEKTFTVTGMIPGESQSITVTANSALGTDPSAITHKTNLGAFPNGRII